MQEAHDPATAVVLLDFVLGYGAHDDPAGAALAAIAERRRWRTLRAATSSSSPRSAARRQIRSA